MESLLVSSLFMSTLFWNFVRQRIEKERRKIGHTPNSSMLPLVNMLEQRKVKFEMTTSLFLLNTAPSFFQRPKKEVRKLLQTLCHKQMPFLIQRMLNLTAQRQINAFVCNKQPENSSPSMNIPTRQVSRLCLNPFSHYS